MTDARGNIVFSVEDFRKVVGKLAKEVPELLTSHPKTAPLGLKLERLKLREALEHQFTVAIVGRMSSGKSTLLNALLGTNALPMGFDETTATVNWIWPGTGDRRKNFRVHWQDGSTELIPLERIEAWIGEGQNTRKTKYLQFFVDSPYLKVANFVDTPGTQSTIREHEQTTRDFITAKLEAELEAERETLKHGGFASAILYVLGTISRQSDMDLIELCSSNTRLSDSSPKNGIAVIQKWDQLERADEDPLAIVAEHCEKWKETLQHKNYNQISEVLATCPPLDIATKHAKDLDIWDELSEHGAGTKAEDMRFLLNQPDKFSSVTKRMRESISKVFPDFRYWDVIRFSLQVAHTRQIDDGKALLECVEAASGIDKLKSIIQTRFLNRSYLLHASSILDKMAKQCQTADGILREIIENRPKGIQDARNLLEKAPFNSDSKLDPIRDFLKKEETFIGNETQHAEGLWRELYRIQEQAKNSQEDFNEDISCLDELDEMDLSACLNEDDNEDDIIVFLQRLFGKDGLSVEERLGLNSECKLSLDKANELFEAADEWFKRGNEADESGHDTFARICEHAGNRLANAAEYIERQFKKKRS